MEEVLKLKRRVPAPTGNKKRVNNPHKLFPHKHINGKKYCRYCGKELTGRQRSWCSEKCMNEVLIICYPSFARPAVYKRDKGICSKCGCDTIALQKEFYDKYKTYCRLGGNLPITLITEYRKNKWPADRYNSRSWWEAHHKVAVIEGGGGCSLDNYETICVPCHKAETASLRKRISKGK